MNPPANTNVLHGVQDGFSIAIPDYLGADMSCYQSIQTDLRAGMGLNDSGVRFPSNCSYCMKVHYKKFGVRSCFICVMCNGVLTFIHFDSCRASLSWRIQYMVLLVILVIGNYFSAYSLCALFCHLAGTGLIFSYLI
jgi:hypothetical protein